MKIAKFVLPVIAAAIATPAFGSLSTAVVPQTLVPGFVANAINWDGPSEWTSAGIVVDLTAGSVYNNTNGGDGPPSTAFIGFVPALAFDTHVGIIDDGSAGIAGGAGDIGGGPQSADAPQISLSWFNTATGDTGGQQIGMITLSEDAAGTWTYVSQGVATSGVVVNGALVPEPASLALLGLGGLAALRRR